MNWRVPRMWEGGDVWIIGGGPSMPVQFGIPEEVVRQAKETARLDIYSPYLAAIHKKHVIGVNVAYLIGDWIDMVFFGDSGFYLAHRQRLAQFPGLRVSCSPRMKEQDNWVKCLARDHGRVRGMTDNPRMVSWNGNSGAAAINVAAHTGAKRIILLGFDMKLDTNSNQWWHSMYGKSQVKPYKVRGRIKGGLPFGRHLKGFPEIAKDAKRRGIEILNASPDSAITDFQKVTVKELLL